MPLLAPPPKFHVDKADGTPAVGWQVFTYLAGTSTPKATYQDFGLGSANTNPITLDARGEATIFLDGSYKFVLKDDGGATIWTVDEIRDLSTDQTFTNVTLAGTLTISGGSVTWSGNPTHSGNHTFSGNVTVNGNTVIGNALTDTLTIAPNAVTWSNNPTHSGNHTWSGTQAFSSTVTGTAAASFLSLATTTSLSGAGFAGPSGEAIKATTYTQNLSAGVNISAFTDGRPAPYIRVGNFVVVGITVDLALTAATTATSFELDLPIASNFTQIYQLLGVCAVGGVAARVVGHIANNTCSVSFTSNAGGTSGETAGIFIYQVL